MGRALTLKADGAAKTTLPTDAVATLGPQVRALAKACGDTLQRWQYQLLCIMLSVRADGHWAVRNFNASIPRQAGKTYVARWLALHRAAIDPSSRIIWTAQHYSIITDTFQSMQAMVGRPQMLSLVDPIHGVHAAAGKEEIRFRNGSHIYFRARENGAIRGLQKISLIIVDEAQILSEAALAGMLPTQNRAANPQTIFLGTPPGPRDMGDVFKRHRTQALAGRTPHDCWIEYSADRDADPLDRRQWRKANPSYPEYTSDAAILNLHDELAADDFRREALGIWDENITQYAIRPNLWKKAEIDPATLKDQGVLSLGIDMPPDRGTLTVGACLRYPDGRMLVEMARMDVPRHVGVMGVVDWVASEWPKCAAVVVDSQSPAMSLLPDLQAKHVKVTVTTTANMGRACGRFLDLLDAGKLIHLPDKDQPQLAQAVRNATTRPLGKSGAVAWNKAGTDVDISPLVACTLALWGASTSRRHPGRKQVFGGA